jgi:uncharacterized membrane protein YsdA (DUF1294 family)
MTELQNLAKAVIEWGALTLVFVIGVGILLVFVIYVIDKTQTSQTIRRNYPVVGRFRYLFEHPGEFFSTIFFRYGPGRIAF